MRGLFIAATLLIPLHVMGRRDNFSYGVHRSRRHWMGAGAQSASTRYRGLDRQSEAYGNPLTCVVSGIPPGMYDVGLYFAETYFGPGCLGGGSGTGARVFDVYLEGTRVLQNFDIFSQVGCAASTTDSTVRPIVKRFTIAIVDGTLDIAAPATVNNGKISAIEIVSVP